MTEIILKLKLVSPLLMFGAFNGGRDDPQTPRPEIRAASIRGGLRYWMRAVYGAAYGSSITGLHEAESRIFGSIWRGSAVTVRVQHSLAGVKQETFIVLPEKVDTPSGRKKDQKFPGFSDSSTFDLHLISHPLRRDVFTPAFTSALMLAFTLGGFGKRARRGGGALQIVGNKDDVPEILRPLTAQNGEALAEVLKNALFPYIARAIIGLPGMPYGSTVVPAYPIFAPDHCRVFVGKHGEDDYLAALKQMWDLTGKPPESFHRRVSLDRSNNQITTRKEDRRTGEVTYQPIPDEWAWGYTLNKNQIRELNAALGRRDRHERRASALHMRVFQCGDGKYYPIVTIFRGGPPEVNGRNPQDENQKWKRVQQVVDLFDTDPNFTPAYGNSTKW